MLKTITILINKKLSSQSSQRRTRGVLHGESKTERDFLLLKRLRKSSQQKADWIKIKNDEEQVIISKRFKNCEL